MDTLKILYVINSLGKGGAERLLIDICNKLNIEHTIEYLIVVLDSVNEYKELTSELKIIHCTSKVTLSFFRKTKSETTDFESIVRDFNPHIIHSHLFQSEILSRCFINPNIIYISHLHGYEHQFKNISLKTLFSKRMLTNLYEKHWLIKKYKTCNNHFLAISCYVKDFFIKTMPNKLNNIILLSNAIDFNRFYSPEKKIKNINKETLIKMVTVGSLQDKKNQIFLVDVVKALHLKNYNVQLDILGDGPNKMMIEKRIIAYNLQNNIFLKANVSKVEDYLHNSSIYVHSASYEPFGLVLIEAMASGLPVVTLDGKGNRDIIEQGKNGFMIYKQSAELFADKIIELIENRELYQSMSTYAIEFAKKYDIKEYVDRLITIYKKAINSYTH